MDKKDELTQIVKIVQKDIGQFEQLYLYTINKVYYWCYTVVKDDAIAKDLAQESMIRIYQKINTLDTAEAFHSWMYILVRNICYRYLESNKNSDTTFLESDEHVGYFENAIEDERIENIPDELYNLQETRKLIVEFVQKLPVKQREVIMLFYLEEFSINEIVEILNSKNGTIKSHLHSGRKNLEKQINEYQEKNNVKLYSTAILSLLSAALLSHEKDLSMKINVSYDKNVFKTNNIGSNSKVASVASTNLIITIGVFLLTSIILIASILMILNDDDSMIVGDELLTSDIEMAKKVKGNPYVDNVTYETFPSRGSTSVVINLKKNIPENDIKISIHNEEIIYEKTDNKLIVMVSENGTYILKIKDVELSFEVNTIDENAPELVGIQNYEGYMQLSMNDELSQIDYDLSYIEYKDKIYKIEDDFKVQGNFNGEIIVSLYIKEDCYKKYFIKVN